MRRQIPADENCHCNVRIVAVAVVIAAALLSSACSREHRNAPARPPVSPTAVNNVRTIIAAIEQDPCSNPRANEYTNCQGRYIAQVLQVTRTALAAATEFPRPADVRRTARKLLTTSAKFQKLNCGGASPDRDCGKALGAVDDDLRNLLHAANTRASPIS